MNKMDEAVETHNSAILVVDDNPANLSVVVDYLAEHGLQIMVARDGETGLRLAQQNRPDLLLLDVRLPGIDGFEVCRRLKADERTRQIPVVFMTVLTKVEDKVKGFEVGGVDYISKPFQHEEVLARVTTHLRLRKLTRELEATKENLEKRVAERTAELAQTNVRLKQEIAERQHAEEEVRQFNRELEQRVADRTAQIEAANKELEAFAYSISHDLRAPLRHIDGFIEMLRYRTTACLDDQSRHYIDVIADSTGKMGMLIDDLLSFSRVSRSEISKAQVDLGELIQEVIREAQPEMEGRDIQWKIALLPLVTGDRAMLRAVMTNLILNALKFTRPRPVAEIEIGYKKGNGAEIEIFVRDNGVGFDMAYVDKLFGVFQRLHQAEEFEGTGIGLANVRRIINRHGGTVWAEGQLDGGATFYFSLPQSDPAA